MTGVEYIINPILMGGQVREAAPGTVKVNLHGRLGVITVPERLVICNGNIEPGAEAQFYFSYVQVHTAPYDYDDSSIQHGEFTPCLLGGAIDEVNDTAIRLSIMNELGTVAVPRRWVFADAPLSEGQNAEFYLSPMKIVENQEVRV